MMKIESTIENGWSLKLHQTQQVDASPSLSLVPNLLGNHSLYTVFWHTLFILCHGISIHSVDK
jgi:hypothetical protein